MRLNVIPAHSLERDSLSVKQLKELWKEDLSGSTWPEAINIGRLRLKHHIHDSISVVILLDTVPGREQCLAFKYSTNDLKYLYHELKFLLTTPSHSNIMSSPKYLVTKKSSFGGKHGVYGFLIPYYPLGSLRDMLPHLALTNDLSLKQQLKWCHQIASALLHVYEKAGTFYSDLRHDNIILSRCPTDPSLSDAILIDFEQRGNWHEWTPPEVLYRAYIEQMRNHGPKPIPNDRWGQLARNFAPLNPPPVLGQYDNAGHGGNTPWFALERSQHQPAMVYSLGLLMYCIFEGISSVRNNLASSWNHDPDIAFPHFRRTPQVVRPLIRRCTAGAPEWDDLERGLTRIRVERKETKLCPVGTPLNENGDVAQQVWDAARIWWKKELEKAEKFMADGDKISRAIERPSLREVLDELGGIGIV